MEDLMPKTLKSLKKLLCLTDNKLFLSRLPYDLYSDLLKYLSNDFLIDIQVVSVWTSLSMIINNHPCLLNINQLQDFLLWLDVENEFSVIAQFNWRGSYGHHATGTCKYEFFKLHDWSGDLCNKLRIRICHEYKRAYTIDLDYSQLLLYFHKIQAKYNAYVKGLKDNNKNVIQQGSNYFI